MRGGGGGGWGSGGESLETREDLLEHRTGM